MPSASREGLWTFLYRIRFSADELTSRFQANKMMMRRTGSLAGLDDASGQLLLRPDVARET